MRFVADVLRDKGDDVWSVAPDVKVFVALEVMAEHHCGALVVLEEGKLAGIFSERDYARKIILHGKASHDTAVSEIMTHVVATVMPEKASGFTC